MLEYIYQTTGLLLLAFSLQTFLDKENSKRVGTGLFWLIYGVTFIFGAMIPHWMTGVMVLALTALAAGGFMGVGKYGTTTDEERKETASVLKNKLFIPAAIVPVGTVAISQLTSLGALAGLGITSIAAIVIALLITKSKPMHSLNEGRRLIDSIGWAAILSQFLAALGFLFNQAGVGDTVAQIVKMMIPENMLLINVIAYCVGMMLFTVVMGNAFAAFAVITTGIGIPLLVLEFGGNASIIGVLGMLSGYCGTLLTPMAANFNVVPAALLELKNKHHVILMQVVPALIMLAFNIFVMYSFAF
ncbi:DUF979 domain-containing protein [Enterovibrio nigricans]|uniref:Uncharacterized membrane protein n=1 Tax=Enterovibrio nigricans DSM 22720 TaxID=1121868 RepID=A0A1T4VRD0_9GAMM|nr:DUF979 domain-containing protein [Enterovibrio nigricans]SKA67418.1 Uncharacterized membrane protein [Enterovibrio nigricans DSM 22720]